MKPRRVCITGLGAVSPAGLGVDALWRATSEGEPVGDLIGGWDLSRNASRIGAMVPAAAFAILDRHGVDEPYIAYAIEAAVEAWRAAGFQNEPPDPLRVGVCIGTGVGGVITMEAAYRRALRIRDGQTEIDPSAVNGEDYRYFLASSANVEVARALAVAGACFSPSTGCTAGLDAIGMAADAIAHGQADIMVAGASEAPFTPIVVTAFDNIRALSRRNEEPRRASRPFDRDRDGFLLGEGAGILILEAEHSARARKARVLGEVLGHASASSAFHMTGLPKDGAPQAFVVRSALKRADLVPSDITYFNLHGTSTPQNDISETAAVKSALGSVAGQIPMSSSKSVLGHALGAASALAAIVCVRSMAEDVIPPTANLETPDEECDLDYVPARSRIVSNQVSGINASGFSGIHTTMFLAGG